MKKDVSGADYGVCLRRLDDCHRVLTLVALHATRGRQSADAKEARGCVRRPRPCLAPPVVATAMGGAGPSGAGRS